MVNPIINPKTDTEMTSFKTVLKSNIKSVDGSKIKKRNVKIICFNKNAGTKVIQAISQNSKALFGGYKMQEISSGLDGDKDFTVKMEIRDGAQYFYDTLTAILNDQSVSTSEPEQSNLDKAKEQIKTGVNNAVNTLKTTVLGIPPTTPTAAPTATPTAAPTAAPSATAIPEAPGNGGNEAPEGSDNKKLFIIGGAVLLVIIIGLVIWKSKK